MDIHNVPSPDWFGLTLLHYGVKMWPMMSMSKTSFEDGVNKKDLSRSLNEQLAVQFAFTPKEAEVLYWVIKGKINRDSGDIFGSSPMTVKNIWSVFLPSWALKPAPPQPP
jgi:hypothetical protein